MPTPITGTVRISGPVSPFNVEDTYPATDPQYGLGGLRTVGTTTDMEAIPASRRQVGMMVYVSGATAFYSLVGTTANSGWTTSFQMGAGTNILPLNNTFTGTNTFTGGVTFAGTVDGATATFSRLLTASAGISTSGITVGNKLLLTSVASGAEIRGISSGGNYPSALFDSNTSNFRVTGIKWSLGNQNADALDANYETTISGDADTGEIVIGAATNKVTITPTSGLSLGNTTTAVTISGTTTVTGTISGNTASFSRLLTASAGISANGATLSGTVTAPTQAIGTNNTTVATTAFVQSEIIADTVTSFNGRTGAAQGVSAAAAGDGISVSGATGAVTITNTGVTRAAAGTGISVSANTGTVTISNTGVLSFNGAVGAVTGASLGANTFTGLNTFSAGLSASSGLFGTLQSNSGATFNADVYVGATLSVNGNLVVNGTTTTINSTTISVDDKNIELGSVDTPSDATANGGGISLKGATDKTIVWSNTTSGSTLAAAWNFNQDINLTKSGNPAYYINGTIVIDGASLGPNIVNSNLTKVGTIATGVWQGTVIGGTYGGTGLSSYTKGDLLYAAASGSALSKLAVSTTQGQLIQADGSGLFAWGDLLIADGSGNGVSTLSSGKYRIQDASTSVKGLSRYDSFNFSVAAGVVGITAIDGGSYT